jgi:hypothetical protein
MSKKYWLIEGYESLNQLYETKIPFAHLSEQQLIALLCCLTAKFGLTPDEIIGGYVRRKTKLANSLLAVHKDGAYPVYLCGTNPHFIARLVDGN